MFEEALARDPARDKRWVALIDGNPSQLGLIKKAAKREGVEPVTVLDIIHVLEYIWKAGIALQGEGNIATKRWVSERLLEVLRGKSREVAAGMRRSATLRKLKAKERLPIDTCADTSTSPPASHLRNHADLYAGPPPPTILPPKVARRGHLRLVS
jgi:hypothetical protein